MQLTKLRIGSTIKFVPCKQCTGKLRCFFCKPKVKPVGVVSATYFDFPIPTVEVSVKGSDESLELTQEDLDDPDLIKKIII